MSPKQHELRRVAPIGCLEGDELPWQISKQMSSDQNPPGFKTFQQKFLVGFFRASYFSSLIEIIPI